MSVWIAMESCGSLSYAADTPDPSTRSADLMPPTNWTLPSLLLLICSVLTTLQVAEAQVVIKERIHLQAAAPPLPDSANALARGTGYMAPERGMYVLHSSGWGTQSAPLLKLYAHVSDGRCYAVPDPPLAGTENHWCDLPRRRLTPTMPACRMSRATRFLPTRTPPARSFGMDAWRAVRLVRGGVSGPDVLGERGVRARPS